MNKFQYQNLREIAHLLAGLFCGVLLSLLIMNVISADMNLSDCLNTTNCTIINNTYVYNYTYITNQTINQSVVYNITNVTCINCTNIYNETNWTGNWTGNFSTYDSRLNSQDTRLGTFESRQNTFDNRMAAIETKYNLLNLSSNFSYDNLTYNLVLTNLTTDQLEKWQRKDYILGFGILIAVLIALVGIIVSRMNV